MYKIIGADGREYGPVTAEQLRQWIIEGRINHQTRVQADGSTEWKPLAEFPDLAGAAPPPPPTSQRIPGRIPNYLVQSILVTLCCCVPFGIPAIVFAAQVNSKLAAGDIAGAEKSSRKAKLWCWLGFGLGLAINILVGIFYAAGMAGFHRFR